MADKELNPEVPETKEAAQPKEQKTAKAEKKPGFGAKIKKFFKDYAGECRKITWMSWPDVWKNTVLVVIASLVIGAVIAGLDFGLSKAITALGGLY